MRAKSLLKPGTKLKFDNQSNATLTGVVISICHRAPWAPPRARIKWSDGLVGSYSYTDVEYWLEMNYLTVVS